MVFNPLGPGLELIWDIIAFIISFVVVLMVVQINAAIERSGKLSTIVTRKVIHIFVAPIALFCWMLFSGGVFSRWIALLVPLMFTLLFLGIGTGKIVNEDFVKSMSRSGDPKELLGGTLYYVVLFSIVTILWFYVPVTGIAGATPMAAVIVGCLAGGDGLADIIGRKYGGDRKFGVGGAEKTAAGSFGMFIGSFLFSIVLTGIYSLEIGFDLFALIIPILVISLVATVVEAITPKGLDNWTVPIIVIVMITLFFYFIPVWWPFPLFTL
jgi:dolichol kinase